MANTIVDQPILAVAVGLNMIWDIIDRVQTQTGVTITPENITAYVAERKLRREQLNTELGVSPAPEA